MGDIILPNGYSGAIIIPKDQPLCLGTAWSIKKRTAALGVLKKGNPFGLTEGDLLSIESRKILRTDEIKKNLTWGEALKWAEKFFPRTKEDAYGFIGGSFDPIDFTKANADGRPNAFARRCLYRELEEEFTAKGSASKFSTEHLFTVFMKDHANRERVYEENYYLLNNFEGELKKEGAPGETEPPEVIPLISLYPEKVYKKTAFILRLFLLNMVEVRGLREYVAPLRHIYRVFDEALRGFRLEIRYRESTLEDSAEPQDWDSLINDRGTVRIHK